jgi:hypothetical protein
MRFEDELGKVLRDTAGTFTTDRLSLAEGSLARGRRRVARRRASVVAGSALAVALLATAGVQLGGPGGDGKARGGHAAQPRTTDGARHFAVTAQEIQNILRNGMSRAQVPVLREKLRGTGSSTAARPATATMDFDDSAGWARVTLSVRRVDPAAPDLKELITCPPTQGSPYEECTTQPDNRAVKGYTEAGKAGGVKKWAVTLLSPHGYLIDVTTQNVPTRKDPEPVTRNPRLNPGKLRNLAMFVDGSLDRDGEPNPFGTVTPGSRPESGDILPVLKAVLPERLDIDSEGGSEGQGHVVVADRKTGDRTYIQATRIAGDKEFWNETLADGTKVGTQWQPGDQPGVMRLRVDALRPNGLWISVSAYNAPSPKSAKTGAKPLVTAAELKAVVTSRTWLLAR